MQSNLNKLIERAEQINKKVWKTTFPSVDNRYFYEIEKNLKIVLPNDFVKLTSHISYECSNFVQFLIVDVAVDDVDGVIKTNLELRKEYEKYSEGKSDMSHILVLADDDGGSVFMITQDSPEKPTPVIWCDYGDMYYYSIHKNFRNPHDKWPSFTAFFEYLVEQEEQRLREDLS